MVWEEKRMNKQQVKENLIKEIMEVKEEKVLSSLTKVIEDHKEDIIKRNIKLGLKQVLETNGIKVERVSVNKKETIVNKKTKKEYSYYPKITVTFIDNKRVSQLYLVQGITKRFLGDNHIPFDKLVFVTS